MMKKLALAFMLALTACGAAASHAGGSAHAAGKPAFDGIYRRAHAVRRSARGRAQSRRRRARDKTRAGSSAAVLPVVVEIDGDGLKNLLARGEEQSARPLLINFWATWCVPCRKEFPDLVKIDLEYRGRGLEFVVISADDVSELKADVPKFLGRMRAAMPAYLLNATDTEAAIAQIDPTWGGELPATFLFNRRGKLVFKHTGIIDAAQLRAQIEKAVTSDK
jgi:thiol-disulfide isomerase/thioredoxin